MNQKIGISILKDTNALDKTLKTIHGLYDENFKKYLVDKVLETIDQVVVERITAFRTDNDEYLGEYLRSNKYKMTTKGFIVYNDAKVDIPPEYSKQSTIAKYPDGKFNVAMAFEYGTGIVGLTNPVDGHWEYNVNDYNDGWKYKNSTGVHHTYGSRGYEIYRFTAIKVNQNLRKWMTEYIQKRG